MAPAFSRSASSTWAKICAAVGVVLGGERLAACGDRRLDLLGQAALAAQPVDELLDLAFGQRAHEAVDRLAVDEGEDRRDRLDAHLRGELLVLVDIDLDELHLAIGLAHDLFEQRRQLLAGAAPRRPEIDDAPAPCARPR